MKSQNKSKLVLIMGVSGCGKSTVGSLLSKETGIPFYDADDFHPKQNIEKMSRGVPLDDSDRMPWLNVLSQNLAEWEQGEGAILACSALKEVYREKLTERCGRVLWVYLKGSYELIAERMKKRSGHYMGSEMLRSQMETLEEPVYGLQLDIDQSPQQLVKKIKSNLMDQRKSDFGVFGLGVMGRSISLNIADKGFELSVYNRSEGDEAGVVEEFLHKNAMYENIIGFKDLEAFVSSLKRPRKMLLMIKAGNAVDLVLEAILPLLSDGDVVIDGGNSFYRDTNRRCYRAKEFGVGLIGCGISGGEEGARRGPSIMPGGNMEDYDKVSEILEAIAAKDVKGRPCCDFVGPEGSGHFIKMVHNGIEYVEMQLLAELYALMHLELDHDRIAGELEKWNGGRLQSYLLEITSEILRRKEGDRYLIDLILDKAGNKGTGSWSSREGMEMGVPVTMMSASVFARYLSSFKEQRVRNAAMLKTHGGSLKLDLEQLKNAYEMARWINHLQGFMLMEQASKDKGWGLDFSKITRMWSGGCIIKSKLMTELEDIFTAGNKVPMIGELGTILSEKEAALSSVLQMGLEMRIPLPCFYGAYDFFVSMSTARLSANLIQAQRDFFGAHTYERIDDPTGKSYHTEWLNL